jgi:hypothetical protein
MDRIAPAPIWVMACVHVPALVGVHRSLLNHRWPTGDGDDVGASGRQTLSERQADSGRGANDDGDAAGEIELLHVGNRQKLIKAEGFRGRHRGTGIGLHGRTARRYNALGAAAVAPLFPEERCTRLLRARR